MRGFLLGWRRQICHWLWWCEFQKFAMVQGEVRLEIGPSLFSAGLALTGFTIIHEHAGLRRGAKRKSRQLGRGKREYCRWRHIWGRFQPGLRGFRSVDWDRRWSWEHCRCSGGRLPWCKRTWSKYAQVCCAWIHLISLHTLSGGSVQKLCWQRQEGFSWGPCRRSRIF